MITKIIAASDIHVRKLKRMGETKEQLTKFLNECKEIVEENGADSTRVVIAGDICHSKLETSGEMYLTLVWFFRELDDICKTIVVAGNHDLNMSNLDRVDSLTPVFEMCKFKQVIFIDRELGYKSGYLEDDNVVWCLYSTFDLFEGPDNMEKLNEEREKEGKTLIGLFHGDLNGAKNASGTALTGFDPKHFDGTDFVIAGHIHKCQEIDGDGARIVYCGSLIQQDMGEAISGHGFVVWDVPEKKWELKEVKNEDYGYYKFKVESEDDIDNDREQLLNE